MSWLHADLSRPVYAPLQTDASTRGVAELALVVGQFCVELAPRYQRRDVTGDGVPETFCNFFVADVTRALGVPVPQVRANEQIAWLAGEGKARGWGEVSEHAALGCVAEGFPCVVGWVNPSGPGHVAIAVPSLDGMDIFIAQAGATNFLYRPVESGFGNRPVRYFVHP